MATGTDVLVPTQCAARVAALECQAHQVDFILRSVYDILRSKADMENIVERNEWDAVVKEIRSEQRSQREVDDRTFTGFTEQLKEMWQKSSNMPTTQDVADLKQEVDARAVELAEVKGAVKVIMKDLEEIRSAMRLDPSDEAAPLVKELRALACAMQGKADTVMMGDKLDSLSSSIEDLRCHIQQRAMNAEVQELVAAQQAQLNSSSHRMEWLALELEGFNTATGAELTKLSESIFKQSQASAMLESSWQEDQQQTQMELRSLREEFLQRSEALNSETSTEVSKLSESISKQSQACAMLEASMREDLTQAQMELRSLLEQCNQRSEALHTGTSAELKKMSESVSKHDQVCAMLEAAWKDQQHQSQTELRALQESLQRSEALNAGISAELKAMSDSILKQSQVCAMLDADVKENLQETKTELHALRDGLQHAEVTAANSASQLTTFTESVHLKFKALGDAVQIRALSSDVPSLMQFQILAEAVDLKAATSAVPTSEQFESLRDTMQKQLQLSAENAKDLCGQLQANIQELAKELHGKLHCHEDVVSKEAAATSMTAQEAKEGYGKLQRLLAAEIEAQEKAVASVRSSQVAMRRELEDVLKVVQQSTESRFSSSIKSLQTEVERCSKCIDECIEKADSTEEKVMKSSEQAVLMSNALEVATTKLAHASEKKAAALIKEKISGLVTKEDLANTHKAMQHEVASRADQAQRGLEAVQEELPKLQAQLRALRYSSESSALAVPIAVPAGADPAATRIDSVVQRPAEAGLRTPGAAPGTPGLEQRLLKRRRGQESATPGVAPVAGQVVLYR